MEGKLLNFNRFLSNFATKLVGGFVPVIVYKYAPSHNLLLAILTLIIQNLVNLIFNLILKNKLIKRPQLFILLRILPIAMYEILLLFIAQNTWLCVIGIGFAVALNYTFKNIPSDVLFAYINAHKKTGTGHQLAFTRLVDQIAIISGVLLGGLVLDHLNMQILIVVSLVMYLIGAMPLFIYYMIHRKEGNLNQEYSTYEHIALKEQSSDIGYANKASMKIRVIYCLYFFVSEAIQAIYLLLPLFTFIKMGTFTYSAIASALYEGTFGIGCFIANKLDENKDITIFSAVCGVMIGVCSISLIFTSVSTIWLYYALIVIMAFSYAILYYFMYHRMLMKSKVVGRNTTCVINRINMNLLSSCFVCGFGLFLPIASCFVIAGSMCALSGIICPSVEEKTRRILVDHLEDNEIREDKSFFDKFRKK